MTGGEGFWELIGAWPGRGVVVARDHPSDAWFFVALHDDTLGRPVGGCRMTVYERPVDGLRDALRLAEGMTRKWAILDLPFGGGKSVVALTRPVEGDERRALFVRFGRLLDTLQGAYGTGEDLGTTPEDMAFLATVTRHVVGVPPGREAPADPGPFTALGVRAGIRAALKHAFQDALLDGRRVLVQGVGDVGAPLARLLAEEGAEVLVADLDEGRAGAVAAEVRGRVVDAASVFDTPCDVFAPCAVGAVIDRDTVKRLRCRVVAGSANNQLSTPAEAEALRARGILYAPDYVVNGGGALAFGLMALGARDGPDLRARVERIGDTLTGLFREAGSRDVSPLEAADERVRQVLERGRSRG